MKLHLNSRRSIRPRPRILFVGEGVTLAHITRPLVLAGSLDSSRYEIRFACSREFQKWVAKAGLATEVLPTLASKEFRERLADGRPLYGEDTLTNYVRAERDLFRRWRPDLIVGDFRISLGISAKADGIPFVNLCNACWSPNSLLRYSAPDLPITRFVGPKAAAWMLNRAGDLLFRSHMKGFNEVRATFGQRSVRTIRQMYTLGDWVLYPDLPSVSPTHSLPTGHEYLGPLSWSPDGPEPSGWREQAAGRPVVYATLGSSGNTAVLDTLLDALERLPVFVLFATAGRVKRARWPANVRAVEFLPANRMLPEAKCCVFNGGAETGYQAMRFGVPVLSLPSSIDQFFHAEAFERAGAGLLLRPERLEVDVIERSLRRLLENFDFKKAALILKAEIESRPAIKMFKNFIAVRCPSETFARCEVLRTPQRQREVNRS